MKNNNAGENMDIFRIKTFNVLLSGYTVCNILSVYFWIEKVGKGNMHAQYYKCLWGTADSRANLSSCNMHSTKNRNIEKKIGNFFTVVCLWLKFWNFRIYVFGTSLSI